MESQQVLADCTLQSGVAAMIPKRQKWTGILGSCAAALLVSCASTSPEQSEAQVLVFNLYRTGAEALPTALEGCDPLGPVSATAPEYGAQGAGFFDPKGLLPTLRSRAARKSADVVAVSFSPGGLERDRRTLRGTAFRCGAHAVPQEWGEPLR